MTENKYSCVILADRSLRLTEGVRGLLETMFESVVIVANVTSLLESAERLQPDVAAVDVSLANDGSLQWIGELRKRCPGTKLLALSVHDEPSVHRTATNAGCDGFVLKRAIAAELLPTVERLLSHSNGQQRPTSTSEGDPEE
jgi:DNA-binding NarL/FixJ family response regulator